MRIAMIEKMETAPSPAFISAAGAASGGINHVATTATL